MSTTRSTGSSRLLASLGHEVIVATARRVKLIAKAQRKTQTLHCPRKRGDSTPVQPHAALEPGNKSWARVNARDQLTVDRSSGVDQWPS